MPYLYEEDLYQEEIERIRLYFRPVSSNALNIRDKALSKSFFQ